MDDVAQVKPELLMPAVREQVEDVVREIVAAVNAAPAGALIAASEEVVRDITGQLRRQLFEAALPQRINAAEAAFPPPVDAKSGKKKRNTGQQRTTVLTINGRVSLRRRWWHSPADGSAVPVDGASWIPPQLDDAQLHGCGLDFYHLAENVHAARRCVFSDDEPTGQTWASTLRHTLKHDGYEAAHEQLLAWLTPLCVTANVRPRNTCSATSSPVAR